jgi:WD40 repeat protein
MQLMNARLFVLKLLIVFAIIALIISSAVAQDKSEIFVQLGHSSVNSIVFSPDGKQALSGGDKTVKLWNVETGRETRTFTGHKSGVFSFAFVPDGRTFVSGSQDKTLKLRDMQTGREPRRIPEHTGETA